ncbi:flagellar assembly protein FliW [Chromobacterium amazonense]|uniref:Flagellar assembly factor FliW n=1 Tax=Chromobacterium amazonense TaxID=1382803 RepID=A0A1S1WWY4_9NEIS|nr:flagellar assembly protein FliW [Chromobacterium amazonense]KIA79310.1 flagellar assembly protein FliW [Chromobacterium piscinae]MDE1712302.1 flagellar assembly protein FliW [Chromobacterium amazonense]MDQ4539030.1 flagellar assembly protein FliW [Chromobacterium amazonense]OHX11803.1 flagellar biosynthesis protein FliW [Chromobacterium amazonense]PRP69724.1 flagellar biosynthesis protein FliW [Chromobacterium amazonense]
MRFDSKQLGTVEVDESTVITFPQGIPALENCTRFKLFHDITQALPQVYWLQSLDDPGITFCLTQPERLGVRFQIELSDDEVAQLQLQGPQDVAILLMLYRPLDLERDAHPALGPLQANLRNPLLIGLSSRHGIQKNGLMMDVLLHTP